MSITYDFVLGFVAGVFTTIVALFTLWIKSHHATIVIDDPTDDEDYQEIVKQLKCPRCFSTDYRFEEVSNLPWIQGEDRYCICNKCGQVFGDRK